MVSLAMADILAVFDFSLRELKILSLVRMMSFGAGKPEVELPTLDHFSKALKITKGNVSDLLKDLGAGKAENAPPGRRVLARRGNFYGFRFPITAWDVWQRVEQIEIIDQLEMLERPACLLTALRDTFVEAVLQQATDRAPVALHQTHAKVPESGTEAPTHNRPSVPESGTDGAFPNREPWKKRNVFGAEMAPVPESGTPWGTTEANLQHCSFAPKGGSLKEQICNVANLEVPDSGTEVESRVGNRLTPEEQEIFDECGLVGAFGPNLESRGCWFAMVKKRPETVKELLGELRMRLREDTIRNPGAWMMDKWIRWKRPDDR